VSLPSELLDQARLLAFKEPRRPKQASLRRAVSTAYYALFHFVGEQSAGTLLGAGPANREYRDLARRAIAHTKLMDVCKEFEKPTPKPLLQTHWNGTASHDPLGIVGDADMATICGNFQDLLNDRHRADYDFSASFSRQDALDACQKAQDAMEAWTRLKRAKPGALKLFALAILLWPGLHGRP